MKWKRVLAHAVGAIIGGLVGTGLAARPASAQSTIFDTLINPSRGSSRSLGPEFLIGQRFILGEQEFDLSTFSARLSSPNGGRAFFFLYDDTIQAGTGLPVPGFPLGALTGTNTLGSAPTVFSSFVSPFRIRANTAYWIVGLALAGSVDFHFSSYADPVFVVGSATIPEDFSTAFTLGATDWISIKAGPSIVYNMRLSGNPVPASPSFSAPEPATLTLVGLAALAVLARRKTTRRKTTCPSHPETG